MKNSKLIVNGLVLASAISLGFLKNIYLFDFMKIKIDICENP
jgi:hypothetical protein